MRPRKLQVEIVDKETRATAISFGLPIEVTRSHPDFVALNLARAWLGEHRSSSSHLYQVIREQRGMNYGDYAYIEAFPRGMYQFFPDSNLARRAQLFEVWIRPVTSHENAHMAFRLALHELQQLIERGLSKQDFERTRSYLMKNVYLLTSTSDQSLGYALDQSFYGLPEYTKFVREKLQSLTLEQVNQAIRKHFSATDLYAVFVTKDAAKLKQRLLSDAPSKVAYDAQKPAELLAQDAAIGALKLGLTESQVRIVPAAEVFAK